MAPSAKSNNHQHQHPFELVTPFVGHLLADTDLPKQVTTASAAEMLQLYESMLRIRRMEVAADALYKARLIRGFCHLGIGQVQARSTVAPLLMPRAVGSHSGGCRGSTRQKRRHNYRI